MELLCSYNLITVNTSLTRMAAAPFPPEFCPLLAHSRPMPLHRPSGALMIDPKPVLLLLTALALGGCDLTSKAAGEGTSASAFSGATGAVSGSAGDRATASAALTNAELGRLIGTKLGAALND